LSCAAGGGWFVVRRDGAVISSTALPHLKLRTDRVSSDAAADARGDVAFTATRGNTAYGSKGTETVYLLSRGAHACFALVGVEPPSYAQV
jgi:hypothetical protein